jgi:cell division protease FtsH
MEQKQQRFSIGYVILAFVVLLMIQNYFATPHTQTITYSQFKNLVQKGLVDNVAIGENIIHGTVKGEGVKEILPPDKLKDALPEVEEGKKTHPFNIP